jgi:hypothetical protein
VPLKPFPSEFSAAPFPVVAFSGIGGHYRRMNETLPTLSAIRLISWLYLNASLARLIRWLTVKFGNTVNMASVLTDYFVAARLIIALTLLCIGFNRFVAVTAFVVLYDVVIAHAAHLFDPNVGAGGAGKRVAAGRSLFIALLNVIVITVLFAAITRQIEKCSSLHAYAVSLSTLTTLGFKQPSLPQTQGIALMEGMTAFFMVAVVLSTVLSGLPARKDASAAQ